MTLKEKIVDAKTGEEIFRDFTAEEIAKYEAEKLVIETKMAKLKAERDSKTKQRAAILEKLGLSEEEAKLLLS